GSLPKSPLVVGIRRSSQVYWIKLLGSGHQTVGRHVVSCMEDVLFADIEASSLIDGFPVEIGWAWRSHGNIEASSLLIVPPEKWLARHTWDPQAEAIHGISR